MVLFRIILARPETHPKTPLAARLRKVRKDNGDPDRSVFADRLGISKNTIAFYERGERTPDANVLEAYHKLTDVDLNWLICGGSLTDDLAPTVSAEKKISSEIKKHVPVKQDKDEHYTQLPPYDQQSKFVLRPSYSLLTNMLGDLIEDLYLKEHHSLDIKEFRENMQYALLLLKERVADPRDAEEIEAIFPQIRVLLKRKLQNATIKPNLECSK